MLDMNNITVIDGTKLCHVITLLIIFESVLVSSQVTNGSSTVYSRRDPLHHLKYYHGGFNVTNKHYLASAAFTGVYGFIVAGVWILFGVGFGVFAVTKSCMATGTSTSNPSSSNPSKPCRLMLFIIVVLLTLLAIVAGGFALAAKQRSLRATEKMKDTMLSAGEDARRAMRRTVRPMKEMQNLLGPYNFREAVRINITAHRLGKASTLIQQVVQKADISVDYAVRIVNTVHLAVIVTDLVLLAAATALLLLHWRTGFIIMIIMCWILTAVCWILTGCDFSIHTFAEDVCSAFEDYVQSRQNNSLATLIPCLNSSTADNILFQTRSTVYNIINQLNLIIGEVKGSIESKSWSDKVPASTTVCQPFSGPPNYAFLDQNCPKNEIPIGQVPLILSEFTCYNNNVTKQCKLEGKFISQESFKMATAYSVSTQDLIGMYPDLRSLARCSFVKDLSRDIVFNKCRPLRISTRDLWLSMLCLSIFMIVLMLTWLGMAYLDKGRSFSMCSIFPRSLEIRTGD